MAKLVEMDVFQVTILVPADLPTKAAAAIRRTLVGEKFKKRLSECANKACRGFPSLATARIRISQ